MPRVGPRGGSRHASRAYHVYRAAAAVAQAVPPAIGVPAARLVGRAAPRATPARRAQVERNLRRVLDHDPTGRELRAAVGATFASYARYFYEVFHCVGVDPAWVGTRYAGSGLEHIRAGLERGRGVVIGLPHLGNWDYAGAWLRQQGIDVVAVAEILEPRELFDWFVATRSRLGIRVIGLGPDTAAEALRALAGNAVVCLLCDRDLTGDGVEVEFFGERTTLPAGPAVLALRSGATLVPAGCYFLPHGRGETHILPPVDTTRAGRLREDVVRVTRALAARLEDLVRAAPTDWHLLQPNWPSDRLPAAGDGCDALRME